MGKEEEGRGRKRKEEGEIIGRGGDSGVFCGCGLWLMKTVSEMGKGAMSTGTEGIGRAVRA